MKKLRLVLSISLLTLCIMAIGLLEASRYSQPVYARLKLLSHGYLSYALGENAVFVGTKAENCSERLFKIYNYGRPVYSKGEMVGCITKIGWFTPAGVNDGRQMLQPERRFIVTLTWFETLAMTLALVSLTVVICTLVIIEGKRGARLMFVSLVFLGLLCVMGISLGTYGITVFKQGKWVPFHPDYGRSFLSFVPAFDVPPTGFLIFWNEWSISVWCATATLLIGTVLLSMHNRKWLPAFGAAYVSCALFAGCGMWIWQSATMNWYEMWLM